MSYAVVYKEHATGRVKSVLGRGMAWHHADRFAAQLSTAAADLGAASARDGYFKAVNESELADGS